jgi:hypothetical protein
VRRVAALVGAIALVVVALVIRNSRDAEKKLGPYRLTCATEFADVCRTLDPASVVVTIEPAGVTANRLAAGDAAVDPGFDGWLAAGPWAAMVAETRQAAGTPSVTTDDAEVGHTGVAVAVWRDRRVALVQACAGAITWKCLGEVAGRGAWKASGGDERWGTVKVVLPDPGIESSGLAGLAAASAGFVGSAAIVPNELTQNDGYQKWLHGLAGSIPRPTPELAGVLTQGPAAADIYIGLEAPTAALVNTSARRGDVEIVKLSPNVDVAAFLARAAFRGRKVPDAIATAVKQAGWVQSIPGSTPLPPAIALAGLRRLWQDSQ